MRLTSRLISLPGRHTQEYIIISVYIKIDWFCNNWPWTERIVMHFYSSVLIYFMKSRLRSRPGANGGITREKVRKTKKTNEFTLATVGTQGEPESICATLWDAIWVVWLLALLCLLHLQWIQVAVHQLGMKTLEGRRVGNKEGCHNWKTKLCFFLWSWEWETPFNCLMF